MVAEPAATTGSVRRELIARAALSVIARVGPDGLTHRRVAEEAGLPLSATTYWFASKEEMVLAGFEHACRARSIAQVFARGADISVMSLTKHVGGHSDVMMGSATAGPELYAKLRRTAQAWLEAFTAFYLELLQQLQPSATKADARLLAAAIDGVIGHQLIAGGPFSRAATRAQLERLVTAIAG